MKTELVKKEEQTTAVTTGAQAPAQQVLSSDIVVPKILLMQGLSKLVSEDRKFQSGDIVRSTTETKIGDDKSKPIQFIPLKYTTSWREQEKVGTKFEFRRNVPRTAANEHYPWTFYRNPQGQEFDKPGSLGATEWGRVKSIDCYALIPSDIDAFEAEMKKAIESGEMPDLTKTVLPCVISFRSTSFNSGKSIATFFAQVQEMRQFAPAVKSYGYTLPLSCQAEKNDLGSYFVWKIGQAEKLDPKYLPQAERWFNTLTNLNEIKVDESMDADAPASRENTRY